MYDLILTCKFVTYLTEQGRPRSIYRAKTAEQIADSKCSDCQKIEVLLLNED